MIEIPYGHQTIDDDDIAAVVDVLRGDWLTQGPAVERFEASLCAGHRRRVRGRVRERHGRAARVALGDRHREGRHRRDVTALVRRERQLALWVEAQPAFVDIDPKTLNLDLGNLGRCDALVAVHYAGLPIDLGALVTRPRVVIEDAAHTLGRATPDGPVGNSANSDACVFSFHPVKTITTGEGGAVTTNSLELAGAAAPFPIHGMVPHPEHGAWFYEISELTPNARITDIQCALGASQLPEARVVRDPPQRAGATLRRASHRPRHRRRAHAGRVRTARGTRITSIPYAFLGGARCTRRCDRRESAYKCTTYPSTATRCSRPSAARPSDFPADRTRISRACSHCPCTRDLTDAGAVTASWKRSPPHSDTGAVQLVAHVCGPRIPPITPSLPYAFLTISHGSQQCDPTSRRWHEWTKHREMVGSHFRQ